MSSAPLSNKVAVITGASRGIGKSIALAFAEAGADLAVCARSTDGLDALEESLKTFGRRCFTRRADLSDPNQTKTFCDDLLREFGRIDILVNNAGAYYERGAFADSDPDLWWKTLEVNVRGPYLMTRLLLSNINEGGKIINLTSGKGFVAGTNSSAYHVSKAALNMLTQSLANETWERGIDVNSLVPGPTATMTFDNPPSGCERTPEEILAASSSALPKGLPPWERIKHPDEVAALALYLATRPPGGPTGQVYSLARRPM
ncbi:SDR family NAD(P)-dependent oxidoreductase [Thioalkalivibrio sp. HK1]|uniref:SDR family NAD(P)-dependent oxidoreductase n=1 Tax=Thioalkalivibrio sp. HK1 TaxID=1469245 RepID=UPI000470922E|nr:SDR family oxidoreductase [Thioalkalivibrio sp. HK1]